MTTYEFPADEPIMIDNELIVTSVRLGDKTFEVDPPVTVRKGDKIIITGDGEVKTVTPTQP